ncbi:MAG: YceI family protein [Deltaproteobacteria bacterium]
MSGRSSRAGTCPVRLLHWQRGFWLSAGLSASLSVSAALGGAGAAFQARPTALLYARVYHDRSRLFSHYSHDHVIHAATYQSEIRFDPAAPEHCFAQLRIPVASLLVDEPSLRGRLGIPGTLAESDRKTVREHLLAEDQLDASRHAQIEILVQSCVGSATSGQYRADVTVTIRGKAQKRAQAALIHFQGGRLRTSGSLRFRHADFGMQPYSAWLGAVSNLEPIDLLWSLEADPAGTSVPR